MPRYPMGVTKLSQLEIDADKDWAAKKIENLGAPDTGDDAPRDDTIDSKITTHAGDASAHHTKTTDAGDITSGVFDLARVPSPLTGKELDFDEVLKAIQKHLGLFWFNNNWAPSDMMQSATSGSGYISWVTDHIIVGTGTTVNSYARVWKDAIGLSGAASWNKKRYFGIFVQFPTYSAQYIHIVSGGAPDTSSSNTMRHIGFKLIDNSLYGTVADGTTEATTLLQTITSISFRRLECILTPGSECRFYVDGSDMGAITTNLPEGSTHANTLLRALAYNTEAADKNFWIYESRTLQEE